MLIEAGWSGAERLKILCGGEALPRDLADQLSQRGQSVWNMYGPTETTIWSATSRIIPGQAQSRSDLRSPIPLFTCWTNKASRCPSASLANCISGAKG